MNSKGIPKIGNTDWLRTNRLMIHKVMNYCDKTKEAMRFIIKKRKAQQDFIVWKLEELNINKTKLKKASLYDEKDLLDRLRHGILDHEMMERVEMALVAIIREIDLNRESNGNRASKNFDKHKCLDDYRRDKEAWEKKYHLTPWYMNDEEAEAYRYALAHCYAIIRSPIGAAKLSILRQLDEMELDKTNEAAEKPSDRCDAKRNIQINQKK